MAKTQDLKRRIRSVKNTMPVTKAMKMVSAARLRRAQESIIAARPFSARTLDLLRSLAARANPELHPLLRVRPEQRVAIVVLTGDRGLCGSLNFNIYKKAAAQIESLAGRDLSLSFGWEGPSEHLVLIRRHETRNLKRETPLRFYRYFALMHSMSK